MAIMIDDLIMGLFPIVFASIVLYAQYRMYGV